MNGQEFKIIYRWLKSFFKPKGLLSYLELVELVNAGVIDAPLSAINGTSIDITLHRIIRKEEIGSMLKTVRLYKKETIDTVEIDMLELKPNGEYIMMPDSIVLGATNEYFNMPLDISAEYSLKSTLGRSYLGHQLAGWIDPGFLGTITLELKNDNQFHKLGIAPFMPIGQVKFFRHAPVPEQFSYRNRGQYNGQTKARQAGILK